LYQLRSNSTLAGGGQVRDIALEIPLRAFAIVRRRQRDDAADPRVQPLRDVLDRAALAGGVAPFEQDHHLLARGRDPVLQLDELALQPEQFAEIVTALGLLFLALLERMWFDERARIAILVLDLHFELFVVAVGELAADHPAQRAIVE